MTLSQPASTTVWNHIWTRPSTPIAVSRRPLRDHAYAPQFGAELAGLPEASFIPISGSLDLRPHSQAGSNHEADVLASINLQRYYSASTDLDRLTAVKPLLDYRRVKVAHTSEVALYHALAEFGPMGLLVNMTMKQAVPIAELGRDVFPAALPEKADAAVTVLMTLGSVARLDPSAPGLLPCRVHSFFRGLPGLWVCMDATCSQVAGKERDGICGKMYSQPRERCECGARVLELYTCRNCGTAYARAYTDDVDAPSALWSEPGQSLRMAGGETSPLLPLDLLLEVPALEDAAEPADYDLETGRLNPPSLGARNRTVYIRSNRVSDPTGEENGSPAGLEMRGQFIPCAVCGETARFGRSYVQTTRRKAISPFRRLSRVRFRSSRRGLCQPRVLRLCKDGRSSRFRTRVRSLHDLRQIFKCTLCATPCARSLRGVIVASRLCPAFGQISISKTFILRFC
jgi:hypothetical protein